MSEEKRPPQVTLKLFIATAINKHTMKALDNGDPMFPAGAQKILEHWIMAIQCFLQAHRKY